MEGPSEVGKCLIQHNQEKSTRPFPILWVGSGDETNLAITSTCTPHAQPEIDRCNLRSRSLGVELVVVCV